MISCHAELLQFYKGKLDNLEGILECLFGFLLESFVLEQTIFTIVLAANANTNLASSIFTNNAISSEP